MATREHEYMLPPVSNLPFSRARPYTCHFHVFARNEAYCKGVWDMQCVGSSSSKIQHKVLEVKSSGSGEHLMQCLLAFGGVGIRITLLGC